METRSLVIYTSQDQVYAEPILKEFEQRTGIQIRTLFDSEATKTVGLANRLLAERNHPQCDVFWSNEELRTRQLAALGALRSPEAWQPLGYRSRRIVVNTNHVSVAQSPRGLGALGDPGWKGKVALAYPLFGTTVTHFLALRQAWGEARWESWCRALVANDAKLVDGNSMVVRLVGKGEAWVGLTDSDDITVGKREGLPIEALPLDQDSLLIPNTVAATSRGKEELIDEFVRHLTNPEVVKRLVQVGALEGEKMSEINVMPLKPNWEALLRDLDPATEKLKSIFLR